MVGLGGLEPPTSPLSGARSSHLSDRPTSKNNVKILAGEGRLAQLHPLCRGIQTETLPLLHKAHVGCGKVAFRRLLNRPKLRFVPRQILPKRTPDPLRVSRAHNRAAQQLPLRAIWKKIDEIQCELFQIWVTHHQVAVPSL